MIECKKECRHVLMIKQLVDTFKPVHTGWDFLCEGCGATNEFPDEIQHEDGCIWKSADDYIKTILEENNDTTIKN